MTWFSRVKNIARAKRATTQHEVPPEAELVLHIDHMMEDIRQLRVEINRLQVEQITVEKDLAAFKTRLVHLQSDAEQAIARGDEVSAKVSLSEKLNVETYMRQKQTGLETLLYKVNEMTALLAKLEDAVEKIRKARQEVLMRGRIAEVETESWQTLAGLSGMDVGRVIEEIHDAAMRKEAAAEAVKSLAEEE